MSTAVALPMVLAEVTVSAVERLSPSFVRLVLAGEGLADIGVDGPWWDQRFKLVVPTEDGVLTSVEDADETWLGTWADRPVEERGHMRTYTVRSVLGTGADTRVVVDVVVHPGASGPGGDWAAAAVVGSRAVALLPRRGVPFGGIEFTNPPGADLLLVGDESAVPAVCAVLEQLPDDATGAAFLEVPVAEDIQAVRRPPGVALTWLARGVRAHGEALHEAVLAHLGAGAPAPEIAVDEVDPDLWETPTWSSSGEPLEPASGGAYPQLHAWIAGESAMVTGLRRHLVRELGVDRSQVAFMGYWRRGVAMRS
ncbi:MAG: siderophore-interacting protein [Nocardioides sp.]|nr:siderophore-interacting protein [Nocardioides sp.]